MYVYVEEGEALDSALESDDDRDVDVGNSKSAPDDKPDDDEDPRDDDNDIAKPITLFL